MSKTRGPGSILCPECRKLVNADEKRCPYCGALSPGLLGGAGALDRIFGERIDLVTMIPIACIVLYLFSLALDPRAAFGGQPGFLSLLSPSGRALETLGMTSAYHTRVVGAWWTTVTAIYLHGSLLHIFFNVLWIRNLGPDVQEAFGPARFFVIFTIAGACGFVVSNMVSGAPTIGASGSIFGLLAALIVHGRRVGGQMGEILSRQVWQWAIVLFIFGFMISGVNNWAHAGGFASGWVAARFMGSRRQGADSRSVQLVALVFLAGTLASFALVAVRVAGLLLS